MVNVVGHSAQKDIIHFPVLHSRARSKVAVVLQPLSRAKLHPDNHARVVVGAADIADTDGGDAHDGRWFAWCKIGSWVPEKEIRRLKNVAERGGNWKVAEEGETLGRL